MKNRRLLILGAGVYQVPAIKKARKMGLETIVLSYNIEHYPGYKYADIPLEVDTTDIKRVVRVAKKYGVDGVFTTGTDVALKALGAVNEKLGLCGPSAESCELSTNKSKMKEKFIKYGIPTARYFEARSLDDARDDAKKIGFPVMVKAVNTSGGRGISKAGNASELERAWEYAKKYTKKNDPIIIEEYLEGVEFGAQAFVYKGKVELICPHNDNVAPPPSNTPLGHSYPFFNLEKIDEIERIVAEGIESLGIDNSAANIDLILTKEGPKILEIGSRMGATCLPELTSIYTGTDVTRECIKMAVGKRPNFIQTKQQAVAGLLLVSEKSGSVIKISTPDKIKSDRDIAFIRLDISEGDEVKMFRVGPDRIGEIVVTGRNYAEAEQKAKKLQKSIEIIVR